MNNEISNINSISVEEKLPTLSESNCQCLSEPQRIMQFNIAKALGSSMTCTRCEKPLLRDNDKS